MAKYYRATETFHVGAPKGVVARRTVIFGDVYEGSDPLVRKYPQWFIEVDSTSLVPVVEAATAAPGERRTVARKKTAVPVTVAAEPSEED